MCESSQGTLRETSTGDTQKVDPREKKRIAEVFEVDVRELLGLTKEK